GQDKGHRGEWEVFRQAIQARAVTPIPFEEALLASLTTFKILESMHLGKPIRMYEPLASKANE
ncbi:MAG: hypothetical protein ABSF48_25380, partial [Thermodesulfobacteriota bacterium]